MQNLKSYFERKKITNLRIMNGANFLVIVLALLDTVILEP